MYSTDPEWCNVHWKHVGREECMDCLQESIGRRIDDIILLMILRKWDVNF